MLKHCSLLNSHEWSEVLRKGFGAERIETVGDSVNLLVWTVFSKYGMKVAYVNFPVGLEDDAASEIRSIESTFRVLRASGVHIARLSTIASVVAGSPGLVHEVDLVETCIEDLKVWQESQLARSVASKVRKARKLGVTIRTARPDEGSLLHRMYSEVIKRRNGRHRYTLGYFQALCGMAAVNKSVSIGVVCDAEQTTCGFIVACHSADRSYYLHGGFLEEFSHLRPGYIGMVWAIERSREFGCSQFNMLTSPRNQSSLVEYKESFGAASRKRRYFVAPLSLVGRSIVAVMTTLRRLQRDI